MRRISKIIAGLTLAASAFGASAACAMGDGYHYRSSTYYYTQPGATYYDTSPSVTYNYSPYSNYGGYRYYGSDGYGYSYYDNPYNPYWGYQGPLGQGSGSDMRIGR
jgi:hypothetical protein